MGILEKVDWEDKIPRNIRFMRVKVRIDPWLPVIASFMLRLDDGSRVWIRCRYERVHKLCTKCGLIGHSRSQCTHSMDDIEVMLFRQRLRIQDLHQVQFRFDALQPQFSNDLRAFHNRRRRWTTQIRYGLFHQSPDHANPNNLNTLFPDPSTPSANNSPHATNPTPNFQSPYSFPNPTSSYLSPLHQNHLNDSSLHSVIDLLNINPINHFDEGSNPLFNQQEGASFNDLNRVQITPPTPANSPISNTPTSVNREPIGLPNMELRINNDTSNPNCFGNARFSMRPTWLPPNDSNLKWTWIEGCGPFITNGQSCHSQFEASDTESDTTVVMFNLDQLNEERPEARQDQGWAKGCIPESPDSFIESLVQRVDCGRCRFELGGSSYGPSLIDTSVGEAHLSAA